MEELNLFELAEQDIRATITVPIYSTLRKIRDKSEH